jgi:hypothetical protein
MTHNVYVMHQVLGLVVAGVAYTSSYYVCSVVLAALVLVLVLV